MLRWLLIAVLSIVTLFCIAFGATWIWLDHTDLASIVTPRLAHATGRTTHIGHLRIHPGRWITIDADDISVANIPTGTRPQMMTLAHLHAQVRLMSLIDGPAQTRDIVVTGFSGLFERTPAHLPNWRFGPHQNDPRAPTAKNTAQNDTPTDLHRVPGIRHARFNDSDVTYRSANGASYRVTLHTLDLSSTDDESPFLMSLDGAYNDIPVHITAEMDSIRDLRLTPERPYATKARVTSGDMTDDFTGTLTDPTNFDGVSGHTTLTTPTSDALLSIVGANDEHAPVKLTLSGDFAHSGNDWHFSGANGTIQDSDLKNGDFTLVEGSHGQPDNVTAKSGFGTLDINGLMPILAPKGEKGSKSAPATKHADLRLLAPTDPDPLIHADLSAERVTYNTLDITDLHIRAAQTPSRIDMPELKLRYVGATLSASGHIETEGALAHGDAEVSLLHGDIDRLRRVAGLAPVPVKGTLAIRVIARAHDVTTLNQAASHADVVAAVSMEKGEIAREVVEAASMDLRLLFRHAKGVTPITCLLGVLDMHQGLGTVAPLRIRTGAGTIAAKATFDLNRRWLDLVFASRPLSTSFFALDVPIRVSGQFANPSLSLAKWSKAGRSLLAESNQVTTLPGPLKGFVTSNACTLPTR